MQCSVSCIGIHRVQVQSGCKVIGQDICQESLKKGELMTLMLNLQVLGKCLARSLNNPTVLLVCRVVNTPFFCSRGPCV